MLLSWPAMTEMTVFQIDYDLEILSNFPVKYVFNRALGIES